jgi:hypothetical protein
MFNWAGRVTNSGHLHLSSHLSLVYAALPVARNIILLSQVSIICICIILIMLPFLHFTMQNKNKCFLIEDKHLPFSKSST